jgi:hypothetical protein
MTKESRRGDDWKQWKSGWKYELDAPDDPEWQRDRLECFRKNGNGWWLESEYRLTVINNRRNKRED